MSIRRVAWAMDVTTGSATRKAVLIALADIEHQETGKCCPRMELLAERLEMGVRTVERALSDLVQAGIIGRERSRRQDGSLGVYHYFFPSDSAELPADAAGGRPVTAAGTTRHSGGSRGTSNRTSKDLEPVETQGAVVESDEWADTSRRVDRKPVKPHEAEMAAAVMSHWNSATGQALTSWDWRAKIIGRVREHPDLTPDDHARIVDANLANPWWTGPPNPSVVYGNAAQFERAMLAANHSATSGAQGAYEVAVDELRRRREA